MNWQPGETLESIEKSVILQAFRFYHGNKTHTANALGIAIRTLDNKLEKYEQEGINERERAEKQARMETEARQRARGLTEGISAETGFRMEPTQKTTAQHAMPVQERQEIQEMPPRPAATRGERKGRPSL